MKEQKDARPRVDALTAPTSNTMSRRPLMLKESCKGV
jgi:hypothetical protein